jgi:hypothetical protein
MYTNGDAIMNEAIKDDAETEANALRPSTNCITFVHFYLCCVQGPTNVHVSGIDCGVQRRGMEESTRVLRTRIIFGLQGRTKRLERHVRALQGPQGHKISTSIKISTSMVTRRHQFAAWRSIR